VGTTRAVPADARAASVTLIANTDEHENHSSSVPEMSRPTTAPAPATPFETRLLARAGGTNPAIERLLDAAEEVAGEPGWRAAAGDAAGR